jgi:hypothetical protein
MFGMMFWNTAFGATTPSTVLPTLRTGLTITIHSRSRQRRLSFPKALKVPKLPSRSFDQLEYIAEDNPGDYRFSVAEGASQLTGHSSRSGKVTRAGFPRQEPCRGILRSR